MFEKINFVGVSGMFPTIVGVMTISFGKKERGNIPDHELGTIYKGIVYGVISAACNGGALVLSKKKFIKQSVSGATIHPVSASFFRFLAAVTAVVILMFIKRLLFKNTKNIQAQPAHVLSIASMGVIIGPLLEETFAMFTIQTVNAAVTQTIFSLVPVFALLMSYFILKEKITKDSLLGIGVTVAGVCLLIWGRRLAGC